MALATGSRTPNRSEPMHYRRRLRTRIIVSFLLLGFGLTALFALATVTLRNRLEGSLVDSWLQSEASNFLVFKRANPDPDAPFTFARRIEAFAYRPDSANIPFGWRDLARGVHELEGVRRQRPPARIQAGRPARAGHGHLHALRLHPGGADPAADADRAGRGGVPVHRPGLADRHLVLVAGDQSAHRTRTPGGRTVEPRKPRQAGPAFSPRRSRRAGRGA